MLKKEAGNKKLFAFGSDYNWSSSLCWKKRFKKKTNFLQNSDNFRQSEKEMLARTK